MKVAVPVLRDRVSPAFDWCHQVLVVDIDAAGTETNRERISLTEIQAFHRPEHLVGLKVDVLLCGGISPQLAQIVEARGIRVLPGTAGEVDAVIEEFLAGSLPSPRFMMPGGRGRRGGRRWRRGCSR